jgi:hypothetical protein
MLRSRVTRLGPLVAAIAAVVVLSAPAFAATAAHWAKDIGGDWFRGDMDDATVSIG